MNEAQVFEFARSLKGARYRDVLALAAGQDLHGLLVLRDQLRTDDSANELLQRLDPFRTERRDRWPGTTLLAGAGLATLHHFVLSDATIAALTKAVDSIYEWRQPRLPEDLCALRADDTTWLVSIAHEGEAWLELTPDEHALVTARFPDLLKS